MDQIKSMFRAYDIRGVVGAEGLNEGSVEMIARAFSVFLKRRNVNRVVVGYDNRRESPGFSRAAVRAFLEAGLEVFDIGLTLSPAAYFAQYHYHSPGVMMLTASHNPNGWSGMKLGTEYSQTLDSDGIKELYGLLGAREETAKRGEHRVVNVRDAYLDNIVSRIHMDRERAPRLVIDAGNGGAGVFAYELFSRLGCTVFQLNCDPDVNYPHYFPNPSNLEALTRMRQMVTHPYIRADLGLAFDGDGDRLGVMDGRGESVWSDRVLMLLAAKLLETDPGAKVAFDVKCTQALLEVITARGGEPLMCKTGHSYIKGAMLKTGAALAGERSGHIFFGGHSYWGFDDALFAGAKLVELLSRSGERVEELLKSYPAYVTSPEVKTYCSDDEKYQVMERLTQEFLEEYGERVNTIDGARVGFEDGWGLVRASTNMPELVMVFEGKTYAAMRRIYDAFREKLDQYSEVSKQWENMPEW